MAPVLIALVVMGGSAYAAEPAGGPALRQARAAWERGALDVAEGLYREALEKGGLAPNEVLEGYVRLGSVRAANGKKEQAIAAFRAASILDSSFAVPSESGSKGPALAERAKRDTAKIGSIQLAISAPKEASPGKPFKVTATLDKPHLAIVNKVVVIAKDGTTGKEVTLDVEKGESMESEVPSDVTLPGASIVVRVDALDSRQNRLSSAEERVRVPESGGAVAGPGPTKGSSSSGSPSPASTTSSPPPGGDTNVRKGGTFWSTPWPYVIGGVAIAGAGAAVYFGTRPPEDVSVGQVGVRTR